MFLVLLLFVSYLFLVNLSITNITLLIDQAYNISWISFVVDEVISNTKLDSILLAKSFRKADVSKYNVFFQKNYSRLLSNSLSTLNLLNIFSF